MANPTDPDKPSSGVIMTGEAQETADLGMYLRTYGLSNMGIETDRPNAMLVHLQLTGAPNVYNTDIHPASPASAFLSPQSMNDCVPDSVSELMSWARYIGRSA